MRQEYDPEYIPPEDTGKKIKDIGKWFAEGFCIGIQKAISNIIKRMTETTEIINAPQKEIENKIEYIPPPKDKNNY